MRIPWRLKSLAFLAFDIIGERPLYLSQKYITGRSSPNFSIINRNWEYHKNQIEYFEVTRIIEFGAGKNLAQNIFLSLSIDGLEQTLVDLNPMIDIDLVNHSIDFIKNNGIDHAEKIDSIDDLKEKYGIEYIAPADMRHTNFPDGHFDACISTNTLEHIPRDDISAIWKECRRVLSNEGIVSAKIDYSDHYAHTDPAIGRLNFLQFSDAQWRRFNHRCHYQNRLRHNHHIELLEENGFAIEHERSENPQEPEDGILAENLTGHPSDFCLAGYIVARKRQPPPPAPGQAEQPLKEPSHELWGGAA
jgi:hypothetical protein